MEELIKLLNQADVRYLVIGGQAMREEGMPRFTMDWDIFIPGRDIDNINKINHILEPYLDMELESLGIAGTGFIQTFQTCYGILQFHLSPPGPKFADAEKNKITRKTASGVDVNYVCTADLLTMKLAASRGKDEDDIIFLKAKLGL